MSKYSLQTECLESIEAYSDEQISREMAVIESVLDIFDKTILMMELSNSDIDLPDCSMFMESTFFQEDETPATGNEQSANNNNNTQMTEEERKAHNKEHWIRQTNKKGKTENILISIIAFIPRFLIFIGRCIGKFFKKIFGKETDDKIRNAANNAKSSEQNASNGNELGAFNPQNKTWHMYDKDQMSNIFDEVTKTLKTLNLDDYKKLPSMTESLKTISEKLKQFNQTQWYDTETFLNAKKTIGDHLNTLKALTENRANDIQKWINDGGFNGTTGDGRTYRDAQNSNAAAVNAKEFCSGLKDVCSGFQRSLADITQAYETALKYAESTNNTGNSDQQTEGQPVNTNQTPTPTESMEGGNQNGGQKQNNQSNAG